MVTALPQVRAEPARGQQLIAEGLELRRAGQDLEALAKFEEAYRLDPTPRAAAQWGLCLQAVGRWSEADAKLAEALKAKTDPWVAKNRATLKESLEVVKQNVGRIEVYGGPDGATVSVNGNIVGVYPLVGPVPVNAGTVDVEVTKEGFKRGYRSVAISGGQYQRVLIRLEERQEKAVAAASPAPNLNPAPEQAPEGTVMDAAAPQTQDERPLYKKPWLWIAVGAVVAGGVVAIALSSGGGGTTGPQVDERGTFGQ
ncbi:MAG: PEGA domain-containing protein [Deltaproteobacteria bacterium]|nr:PEGA domain-containing protein [Deltaproteobacteria bacterium]